MTAPIDFNQYNLAGGFQAAYEAYLRRELAFNGNSNGIFYLSSGGVGAFTSTGSDDASLAAAFARNPEPASLRGRQLLRSQCAVLCDRVYAGAPERVARRSAPTTSPSAISRPGR